MNNCTKHGFNRICERIKITGNRTNKLVDTVLKKGKRAEDYKSLEKYYLQDISRNGCFALTYNNFLFVMNEFCQCVTVFHLPFWFGRAVKHNICRKNDYTRSLIFE